MTQLDRIEKRFDGVDDRLRAVEVRLGELKGERRAMAMLRHALTAVIAALAGLFGGNLHIPGAH